MLVRRMLLLATISLGTLYWSAGPARADMFRFTPITFNSGTDAYAVAPQLSLDVTQSGSQVLFTFANDGPVASTITGTYFDDGAGLLASLLTPINGSGVSFKSGGNPTNLPAPMDPYHFGANFWATAKSPKGLGDNGVDNTGGEFVTIPFALEEEKSFADVLAALGTSVADPTSTIGTLRVGIHVQSIGTTGLSDAFVLTPVHAPLPGAALLGVLGLGAAGLRLRRFA